VRHLDRLSFGEAVALLTDPVPQKAAPAKAVTLRTTASWPPGFGAAASRVQKAVRRGYICGKHAATAALFLRRSGFFARTASTRRP
jgi:hypothetical protein